MTQPTIMDCFNRLTIPESNNETEEYIEEITLENPYISDVKEIINDSNKIVEVRYGNEIYRTWKVEFIRPFIYKFLKEKVPNCLLVREINKIDITIFDNIKNDQTPVEIQKTPISRNKFAHHNFEEYIRTQLDINIKNYGKCWFFFDSEYLRFLQSGNIGKGTSIDLTWLVKLMRENTLKVFTIKYDGTVKELITKDFDFLKNISQVCEIGYDNDERILNRNKLKIFHNVINGYKLTQEEITQFENEFDNRDDTEYVKSTDYFNNSNDERCKLYGSILSVFRNLYIINNILSCNCNKHVVYCITLGILYQNEFRADNHNSYIKFIDKFDIAQYFPGYIRNKEMWNYCKRKQRSFSSNEFYGIIEGTFNYEFIKKQSTMSDY